MFCECGCGVLTGLATKNDTSHGWVKGQPKRFIAGHHGRLKKRRSGYTVRYRPSHPRATSSGDVREHILVAEAALGRHLPSGSEVHHVDENTLNNANGNLVICQSHSYHQLLHMRAKVVRAGGNPNTQRFCGCCKKPRELSEFHRRGAGLVSRCRECSSSEFRRWWNRRKVVA